MASTSRSTAGPSPPTRRSRPSRSPGTPGPASDAAATCIRCGPRPGASSPTTTCRGSRSSAACGRRGARRASTDARRTSGTPAAAPARSSSKACSRRGRGPIVAGFRSRHRAVDRTVRPPLTAETETWEVRLPALGRVGPRHRVLDLTIRHEVVLARPIVVAAAAYGGLGLRGPRAWSGGTGMAVVTSEGRTRRTASRSRARWVAMVGLVGGGNAGVAILDHPDNLRHPQPLFVDGGQPFVSYAAMQSGPITLTHGPRSGAALPHRHLRRLPRSRLARAPLAGLRASAARGVRGPVSATSPRWRPGAR